MFPDETDRWNAENYLKKLRKHRSDRLDLATRPGQHLKQAAIVRCIYFQAHHYGIRY